MVGNLKKGDRVKLHPATDHFMRGNRYATLVEYSASDQEYVRVQFDGRKRIHRIRRDDVLEKV